MTREVGDADTIPSLHDRPELSATVAEEPGAHPEVRGPERGHEIGRFVVLEELGTGGMGVVYAAYDPNLDRKVAIKLLRAQAMASEEARVRLLREAQAMARIDHPNVLRVHEAGTFGDQIYIAMEFAAGGTLRQWLAGATRGRDEILDVFVQAGRGLAAAHDAGLVHRDFKPDNVLLVADGHARVTDFGLVGVVGEMPPARPSGDLDKPLSVNTPLSRDLTRTGALMGTPAYMSPEQFKGGVIGPAADQFAFCVALYEALYRTRPFSGSTFPELCASVVNGVVTAPPRDSDVPSRIRRVLLRGLSTDPDKRYATMDRLLAELSPNAGSRRRTVIAASSAGVLAAAAIGVFALRSGNANVCSGGDARVAAVWSPEQKQKLLHGFDGAKRLDTRAVVDRTAAIIDRWGTDWQHAYVGACEDTRVRKVQSEHLLDLRMDCLSRALDEAHATIDALSTGGADAIDHAIEVVRGLPPLGRCADTAALASGIAPPSTPEARATVDAIRGKLDAARAQRRLSHYAEAKKLAEAALADARASKYDPLIADALLEAGRVQAAVADPHALDMLEEAMMTATAAGDNDLAIRAASRRIVNLTYEAKRMPLADEISRIATALATHASPPVETRVDLDDAVGMMLDHERKFDAAKERYDHALQLSMEKLGPDAPLTITTLQSLGVLAAERHNFPEAKKLFEQVLAAQERIVGKMDPDYAQALEHVANVESEMGDTAKTGELREQALAIRLAALGPDHPDVAMSYGHLAGYYATIGEFPKAKTYFERALELQHKLYGDDSVSQTTNLSNYGLVLTDMGDYEGARTALDKALAIREKAYGPDDPRVGEVVSNLALAWKGERRYDKAIALLERAEKIAEKAYGAKDNATLDTLGDLVTSYIDAGKLPEAREQVAHLMSGFAANDGPDSEREGLALGTYGKLQAKLLDWKGSLASFEKADAILEDKAGKDHPEVAAVLVGRGEALNKLARGAEAVPLLEHAIAIGDATHMPPSDMAEAHLALADALAATPATRARAKTEAETARSLYEQVKDDQNVALAKAWLKSH